MTLELDADLEQALAELMKSGGYATPNDALRALLARESDRQARLERLRAELQVGMEQLDRGESFDADKVFDEVMADRPELETVA